MKRWENRWTSTSAECRIPNIFIGLDGRKTIRFQHAPIIPDFGCFFSVEHLKYEEKPRLHTWSNLLWPRSGVAQGFQLESYIMQKKWPEVGVYAFWRYMCNVMTGDHYVFIRNMALKSPQTGWAVVHNVFCWWNFCSFTEVQVQLLRWIGVELDTKQWSLVTTTACCVQEMVKHPAVFFFRIEKIVSDRWGWVLGVWLWLGGLIGLDWKMFWWPLMNICGAEIRKGNTEKG